MQSLPESIRSRLQQLTIIVQDEPDSNDIIDDNESDNEDTLGVHFDGNQYVNNNLSKEEVICFPEHIKIFRGPLMRAYGKSHRYLKSQIRITILHEFGHHLGLDEEELEKIGLD
ncbi:MAG: metallopeptidase family protein [Oligoflexia bacterium]|nr:metallopeptidase family protein [Oligoflexia bacterium]